MMRGLIGMGFCAIAAFLYSANFFAAALTAPDLRSWTTPPGKLAFAYEKIGGTPLITWAWFSLII